MARWTHQQVLDSAPDDSSLKAAQKLAKPPGAGPWSDTGATEVLLWGKCQGSGRTPYQVSVDLTGPAYRCSCPSRKFPCKHAVALLMLWSADQLEGGTGVADFAREWAQGRAAAGRPEPAPAPGDPAAEAEAAAAAAAAAAERARARGQRMDEGLLDFRRWLTDAVRGGLAAVRNQPYSWWDRAAARLVDAQVPRLADEVREGATVVHDRHRGQPWAEELLARFGRWWLLSGAWLDRENLTEAEAAEVRIALGWPVPSAQVRAAPFLGSPAPGPWTVLGVHRDEDGDRHGASARIQEQRTWLRGPDGEVVQMLDFAAAAQGLPVHQLAGAVLEVDCVRYPGLPPYRVQFLTDPVPATSAPGAVPQFGAPRSIAQALADCAEQLDRAPWRDRFPVVLGPVHADLAEGRTWLVDAEGHRLDLHGAEDQWRLLAASGGAACTLFGELDEGRFRPLTLLLDDRVVAL